ncbi:MAG: hypothetical protein IPG88_27415 [Gemmatimonadetes bacterium]|nr:hypothetical protein [Gemmatimonadota bacterium]
MSASMWTTPPPATSGWPGRSLCGQHFTTAGAAQAGASDTPETGCPSDSAITADASRRARPVPGLEYQVYSVTGRITLPVVPAGPPDQPYLDAYFNAGTAGTVLLFEHGTQVQVKANGGVPGCPAGLARFLNQAETLPRRARRTDLPERRKRRSSVDAAHNVAGTIARRELTAPRP